MRHITILIYVIKKFQKIFLVKNDIQGRQTGGGGWEVATPPECWMEGLDTCQPPPDFEKIFIMGGWLPLN